MNGFPAAVLLALVLLVAVPATPAPAGTPQPDPRAAPPPAGEPGPGVGPPSLDLTPEAAPAPHPQSPADLPAGTALLLNVPYRSQFDGSPYANANCGPTSLAMVLEAYGIDVPTERLRELANGIQGTAGYSDGVAMEPLQQIAREAGLETAGLYAGERAYARWTVEDVRRYVTRGWPVVTLVHYRSLPGNEAVGSASDHYVVVVGVTPDGFLVNDPAFPDQAGRRRPLTEDQLRRAWSDASIPGQAVAFGPGDGHLPVAVAPLLAAELAGVSQGAAVTAAPSPTPLPTATPRSTRTPRPTPTATPTRTPVPDRWTHRDVLVAPTLPPRMPTPRPEPGDAEPATAADDAVVLAVATARQPDHLAALGVALGVAAAGALVLRRREREPRRRGRRSWSATLSAPEASCPPEWPSAPGGAALSPPGRERLAEAGSRAVELAAGLEAVGLPRAAGEPEAAPRAGPRLRVVVGSGAPTRAAAAPMESPPMDSPPALANSVLSIRLLGLPPRPSAGPVAADAGPARPDGGGPWRLSAVRRSLLAALESVPDPRHRRGQRYGLASLLVLVVCAVLGGARSPAAIARWGKECGREVRRALGLQPDQSPSAATLRRVLGALDRGALAGSLRAWLRDAGAAPAVAGPGEAGIGPGPDGGDALGMLRDLAATIAARSGRDGPIGPEEALALVGLDASECAE